LRVLLAGVSTRAAAESAARAGFAVTAIDAFADADQHPGVDAQALRGRFSADAAALLAQTISCDAVVYGSNFENHPRAVDRLAAGRRLWGNASEAIRRVRDPTLLSGALRQRGLPAPAVANDESQAPPPTSHSEWLLKPRASGGGQRVRRWRPARLPPGGICRIHRRHTRTVAFVAARRRVVPIGFCRQRSATNRWRLRFRYT
jgi:predicted ATP-grasp superfamily ATP-dependent carboligase